MKSFKNISRKEALKIMAIGTVGSFSPVIRFVNSQNDIGARKEADIFEKTVVQLRYPYSLPELPYSYNAVASAIDAQTMEIHHSRHHQAYIDKLNRALESHPDLQVQSLPELLSQLNQLPDAVKTDVRNHGGGHYNHTLFWELLSPQRQEPHGELLAAVERRFGSFPEFKESFEQTAASVFGSGWGWLVTNGRGDLDLMSTANQDTPLEHGMIPVIGVDVWEHAYYLNYQNRREDYLSAFWNIVNWERAEEYYRHSLDD